MCQMAECCHKPHMMNTCLLFVFLFPGTNTTSVPAGLSPDIKVVDLKRCLFLQFLATKQEKNGSQTCQQNIRPNFVTDARCIVPQHWV